MSSQISNGDSDVSVDLYKYLDQFDASFPKVIENCIDKPFSGEGDLSSLHDRFIEVLKYNVPHGKKLRGLLMISSACSLQQNVEPEKLESFFMLGWCIELLQASCLVADDIMDGSTTRRNKPCWYKTEGVGLIAINHTLLLENCLHKLLQKVFGNQDCYLNLSNLFHEVFFQTICGQELDTWGSCHSIESFTFSKFNSICKWKTAFYTVTLPLHAAMIVTGHNSTSNPDLWKFILEFSIEVGIFFQTQDDYLDVYGDPNVTGKIGTDIQDNKCSWLVVKALELASDDQKRVLTENYGKTDEECVAKVKAVFNALDLERVYSEYEAGAKAKLHAMISRIPHTPTTGVCDDPATRITPVLNLIINLLFKRKK